MTHPNYDFWDDFARSIEVAYAAVRERIANGGPPYMPPPSTAVATRDEGQIAIEK